MLENETTTSEKNAQICSMCGEENKCGVPKGQKEGDSCWCFSVVFSEPLKETLKKNFSKQACICRACFERQNSENSD